MDLYAIYLRKSRIDLEAERSGQGETLKRHETALLALAKQRQYPIGEIYREVVSGDTISGRPEMQRLLADVESGRWKGVLCMEESRLARGDTMDQGRVQQAFYYSHTLIITPNKIFDPDSEADQEYFEFGLFMSRREYKMINRRLQRGRLASVKEGKWVGGHVPYGYRKVDIPKGKGKMLVPVPEEAQVVQAVYHWFVEDNADISAIAKRLNGMGLKTAQGHLFGCQSVRDMLDNPVYAGWIRYGSRQKEKIPVNGKLVDYHHRAPDVEGQNLFRGRHEPIISEELYQAAKARRSLRRGTPGPRLAPAKNPFAGLVYCSRCGRAMARNPGKPGGSRDRLMCMYPSCSGIVGSTIIEELEGLLLSSLQHHLAEITIPEAQQERRNHEEDLLRTAAEQVEKELAGIATQRARAFDLVELGTYTPEIFTQRMEALAARESELQNQLEELNHRREESAAEARGAKVLAPKIKRIIDLYPGLKSPHEKNNLLKTAINHITYARPKGGTIDDLRLKIYYIM